MAHKTSNSSAIRNMLIFSDHESYFGKIFILIQFINYDLSY